MSLITVCLLPMIVLTILSPIFEATINPGMIHHEIATVQRVIDELKDLGIPDMEWAFDADWAIAILVTMTALVAILGIQIFGSGLGETTVRILTLVLTYMGLWFVLTILALPLIKSIEIFGDVIYGCLTIGYVTGIMLKLMEGG